MLFRHCIGLPGDALSQDTSIRKMLEEAVQPKTRLHPLQPLRITGESELKFINITNEPASQIMEYAGMVRSHARRSFVNRKHALRQEHRNTNIQKRAQISTHCNKNGPRQLQGKFRIMKWRMEVGSGGALQDPRNLENKIPKSVVR